MVTCRSLIILLLILAVSPLRAQTTQDRDSITADSVASAKASALSRQVLWPEYSAFQIPYRKDSIIAKSLFFGLRTNSYFKNNEFRNAFETGVSLVGIFFEPALEYHPDSKTTIRTGAHLLKYHGADHFDRLLPVLTLQYDASDHFTLVFGTIYGTVNHGLIEPVQDFENYLINNYENGFQLLWNYPQFRSDLWLNWEQFLKPGDPFQEKFTAGSNSSVMLLNTKRIKITAPLSAVFRHRGGEIDASGLSISTQLNMVLGLRVNWMIYNSFFKSLSVAQNYAEFAEINPGDQVKIFKGHGSYSRFFLDTKIGGVEAGYWKAHDYISPHGMPLFQSVSQKDPLFLQSDRELLAIKYLFERSLTGVLKFALRLESYYHFDTSRIDHAWSVYLSFNDDFLISRTKRN